MVDARENILNILEENGVINRFKSDLRAQVLKAMNKSLAKPETLRNLETPDAQMCLELIWDFIEWARLSNTLEIFVPECNLKKRPSRNELDFKAGVKSDINKPVLFSVLEKSRRIGGESPEASAEVMPKFVEKPLPKVPEIGLMPKKDITPDKKPVVATKFEPPKPAEKLPNTLPSLSKPLEKPSTLSKLQPLTNQKKITNLRSFDVLADEEHNFKHDESVHSSINEEISEDYEEDTHKDFYESQGTSSMGVDASVNSLALEEFDHIEPIRPPKKR
jgi:hypothetical protein